MSKEEFIRLMKPYQGKLYALARQHDPFAAEDLTLEIMTTAYQEIKNYPPGLSLPVWLAQVALPILKNHVATLPSCRAVI